jgi:hypothetical protein
MMDMSDQNVDLTIVEPRLDSPSGHFHSLVASIASALPNCSIRVACTPNGAKLVPHGCIAWPGLRRGLSKVGLATALRHLGCRSRALCLLTACDRSLLVAASVLPRSCRVTGIVHDEGWIRRAQLVRLASWIRNDLSIACFGAGVAEHTVALGVRRTRHFAYPIDSGWFPLRSQPSLPTHLLMAGGPRLEKGFVECASWALDPRSSMPLPLRIHLAKPGKGCLAAAETLRSGPASTIEPRVEPLSPGEFRDDFMGALVLLLHEPGEYNDRASGLFLDAVVSGAPFVARQGTRFAEEAIRFGIGVVTPTLDPQDLSVAVQRAVSTWPACVAALVPYRDAVVQRHAPDELATFILGA